ncbi:MAG: M20/M25/M40 family metallo-hydrolase [Actinobacteria bacterium]|nr:M20/M25/M40 family metallo-hydrolase [Actinomycetota bacterium]
MALTAEDDRRTGETVELLQTMIRNRCVNDGRPESGEEVRNADTLTAYLGEGTALDFATYDPLPGRRSIVSRLEGTDPDAPTICLMGHTDVVPVEESGWSRDPFGGELVDGEVWGRGAIDMLNLTSSMAVAFKHLSRRADRGERLRGTVIYFGVADEEAGGTYGADFVTQKHWDDVACDYVLTESGGIRTETPAGPKLVIMAAEKGIGWRTLKVRGTPAHGSMPFGSDNAVVKAAEVVRRLAAHRPKADINDYWSHYVRSMALPPEQEQALLHPDTIYDAFAAFPRETAKMCHAMTHMTISPNVLHGGQKTNTIPDLVEINVDVRTLPGQTEDDVQRELREALGDLADDVEMDLDPSNRRATESARDNPMWDALVDLAGAAHPDAEVLPFLIVGGTDAAFFREKGVPAYGAGLFSSRSPWEAFADRFHGNDERLDVDSLGLTTRYWIDLADRLLG